MRKVATTVCHTLMAALTALMLAACHDDPTPPPRTSGQTVVVLMPWSSNMKPFFDDNIDDMADAIAQGALDDSRWVVCIATSPSRICQIELSEEHGTCVRDTIAIVDNASLTSATTLTNMLDDIGQWAPARRHALIVGGHGMAWLPIGKMPWPQKMPRNRQQLTRWVGGLTAETQLDITSLAAAIARTGQHMDYILFDDCYMASVEVAYTLRQVTDHVVGCPTEIMAYGFPYRQCLPHLVGQPDYRALCEAFLAFYTTYEVPCGTIAVVDCSAIEGLATVVRAINTAASPAPHFISNIQQLDGYYPALFHDFGHLFVTMCTDSTLLTQFRQQLNRAVPHKAHTEYYYAYTTGYNKIRWFSGLNTSQMSNHPLAVDWSTTAWHEATMP